MPAKSSPQRLALYRADYRRNKALHNARRTNNRRKESRTVRAARLAGLKAYYQRNKERFLTAAALRSRIKSAAPEAKTIQAWMRSVLRRPFAICYYCRKTVVTGSIDFDHVIPLSKGGQHALSNLCVSCPDCNGSKHDHLLPNWPKRGQLFLPL